MVLDWVPSVGFAGTANDPINISAKEIYAKVRKAYSSSLDADGPDMIIYMLALDSVFTYIAALKRIYRLLNAYRPDNYDMPDALLISMGLTKNEIATLRLNKTQMWQLINELVLQSRKFTCPEVMDLFNRHYWMSDRVFTDAPSWNSQFYLFNLAGVLAYTSDADPSAQEIPGCEMLHTPWADPKRTTNVSPKSLYDFGVDLINRLVLWDDAYTINGYFMRAFEGQRGFIVDQIEADPVFEAAYSEEVLTQIENSMTVAGGIQWMLGDVVATNTNLNVWQVPETNLVASSPQIAITSTNDKLGVFQRELVSNTKPYINLRSEMPTAIENTIATRLKCESEVFAGSDIITSTMDCATEIALCWRLIPTTTLVGSLTTVNYGMWVPQKPIWAINLTPNAELIGVYSKLFFTEAFDWHPTINIVYTNAPGSDWKQLPPGTYLLPFILGDIHNETIISKEDLENLHRVCCYSEFNSFGISNS